MLSATFGDEFDTLYQDLESRGLATRVVPARVIWAAILESQIQTGGPIIMYKDAINSERYCSL